MSNDIVLRSDKVKEGLKFYTSLEELLDQLEPILPNTITQELSKHIQTHQMGTQTTVCYILKEIKSEL